MPAAEHGSTAMPGEVLAALLDDLNTPEAIGRMTQLLDPMALKTAAQFFGLLNSSLSDWQKWTPRDQVVNETDVDSLVQARVAARNAKNFKESDRIRDELLAKGIVLKDGPDGTTWGVKR